MRLTQVGTLVGVENAPFDFVNDEGRQVSGRRAAVFVNNSASEPPATELPTRAFSSFTWPSVTA